MLKYGMGMKAPQKRAELSSAFTELYHQSSGIKNRYDTTKLIKESKSALIASWRYNFSEARGGIPIPAIPAIHKSTAFRLPYRRYVLRQGQW